MASSSTAAIAEGLFANLHAVLKAASSKCRVIDEKFPSAFFEEDPTRIFHSYQLYITKLVDQKGEIYNEDVIRKTTIGERFDNGEYVAEKNGFYRLFHDLKLVCTILVHYYPRGSRSYHMVDKFFQFISELILRECYRLGVTLSSKLEEQIVEPSAISDLDNTISRDFIKISKCYQCPIAQSYYIRTKGRDLFTSILQKSSLDMRPEELPNSNFEMVKLLPQSSMIDEAPMLGFVAANTSNIPDPTLSPTEIMNRFLHPNWYALPITLWLKYGDYQSFAPFFNENGTVLDSTTRGLMWLDKVGYNKMLKDNKHTIANQEANVHKSGNHDEDKSKETEVGAPQKNVKAEDLVEGEIEADRSIRPPSIKLENIYNWTPASFIDDDEIEAFGSGGIQKVVSSLILKLQALRRERMEKKSSQPSFAEVKLYHKVRRLLKETIFTQHIDNLPINQVVKLPVLQANYNGRIPVVRAQPTRRARKSRRV